MPLVELAPSAAARAQLARPVLAQLHARHAAAAEQPVAAAALLRLACILHDNIRWDRLHTLRAVYLKLRINVLRTRDTLGVQILTEQAR